MNNKSHFYKAIKVKFVSNTVFLVALTGCWSYAHAQGIRINIPAPVVVVSPPAVVVAPPAVVVGGPVVVAEDNYVYYPSYGVYYNTRQHQYAYQDAGVWVSRPAPMGVSAEVLLASPSVKMDFHDSPANHHTDMARKYPKNYRPARSEEKAGDHDDRRGK